jgi:hypothetical protein
MIEYISLWRLFVGFDKMFQFYLILFNNAPEMLPSSGYINATSSYIIQQDSVYPDGEVHIEPGDKVRSSAMLCYKVFAGRSEIISDRITDTGHGISSMIEKWQNSLCYQPITESL